MGGNNAPCLSHQEVVARGLQPLKLLFLSRPVSCSWHSGGSTASPSWRLWCWSGFCSAWFLGRRLICIRRRRSLCGNPTYSGGNLLQASEFAARSQWTTASTCTPTIASLRRVLKPRRISDGATCCARRSCRRWWDVAAKLRGRREETERALSVPRRCLCSDTHTRTSCMRHKSRATVCLHAPVGTAEF